MRIVEVSHPVLADPQTRCVRLYPVGDMHIGAAGFDMISFRQYVARIAADPCGLVLGVGDWINNSTRSSIGVNYEETIADPQAQCEVAAALLEPVADRIIAMVRGNHCYRSRRSDGLDPMSFMAYILGRASVYYGDAVCLKIAFGKKRNGKRAAYTVFLSHGAGGGRTVGGKAAAMKRGMDMVLADVVVLGHSHAPIAYQSAVWLPDPQNNVLRKHVVHLVNSGTWLDGDTYAERALLPPAVTGAPVVVLSGDGEKSVRVVY